MKRILPAIALLFAISANAQELVETSYGASYKNQQYYRLLDDAKTNIDNNSWDIAFTTFGNGDAGIHLNESSVTFGAEAVLYLAPTNNFNDPINSADLIERLYNDEKSWNYGAFNSTRDVNDPNDFGWGTLDSGTGDINGTTVFALRFKNGTFQKIQIVSLAQGVYTLKHADLDGSNETTLTVDKADFADANFAYLSLATGQTLPSIPHSWDLAFVRYAAPNDDGAGGIIQIMSSGVLSAPGVEVAQANNVVPSEVEFADFEDSLSSEIDIIGSDWKFFNNVSWTLAADLAFFVKTPDGAVYKIYFVDFGGSANGNVVFSKELVIQTSADETSAFDQITIYPNPATSEATLLFSMNNSGTANILVTDLSGKTVWTGKYNATVGFNAANLPLTDLPAGHYLVTLRFGDELLTQKLMKH